MTNNGPEFEGFSAFEQTSGEITNRIFKCDLCRFTNTDTGGMKRHIARMHKTSGSKRGLDERAEASLDDREDKRPKIDEHFEPDLVSTQISENDEELDEFEEALLAEENDYQEDDLSLHLSDKILGKIGNDTNFDINDDNANTGNNDDIKTINEHKDVANSSVLADVAIMKVRIKVLEDESKSKDLNIEELEAEVNNLAGFAVVVPRLENEIIIKDGALEAGLSRINILEEESVRKDSKLKSLEDEITKKSNREQLLERALKKRLKKNQQSPNDMGTAPAMEVDGETANDDDFQKLKKSLKGKDALIRELKEGKVILANELKDAQEKLNGSGGNHSIEKCIKLTKDLKNKTNECKAVEKENKELKESLSKFQIEMNQRNNKVAEIEAQNVRLNELNNKLFEISKSSGIFKNLEETNRKEVDAQKIVFEENPKVHTRHGNKPKHVKEKAGSFHPKATEKCYFYENGFCRKGAQCSFNHPSTMCKSFWSYGDCDNGVQCPDRHPLQVCIKYLNNTCIQGDKCVYQHPQIAHSKSKSPGYSASPNNFGPNTATAAIPSFFPAAANHPSAPTHRSPAHNPGWQLPQQEQQFGQRDQHHWQGQGNEHGHLGQQQGQGWQK